MAERKLETVEKSSLDIGDIPDNRGKAKGRKVANAGGEALNSVGKVVADPTGLVKTEGDIKPVAKAKKAEQTRFQRWWSSMGMEDGKTVGQYLLWDVGLPWLKDGIFDFFNKGLSALLYGEAGAPKNVSRDGRKSKINYVSYSDDRGRRRGERGYDRDRSRRNRWDFRDVRFDTRREAEEVLSGMVDIIEDYEFCKVSDFYALADMPDEPNDHGYGWDRLGSARVEPYRGDFVIDLPRPIPIDR